VIMPVSTPHQITIRASDGTAPTVDAPVLTVAAPAAAPAPAPSPAPAPAPAPSPTGSTPQPTLEAQLHNAQGGHDLAVFENGNGSKSFVLAGSSAPVAQVGSEWHAIGVGDYAGHSDDIAMIRDNGNGTQSFAVLGVQGG